MGWFENVRGRYQAPMNVPQEDMAVKIGRLLKSGPQAASQPQPAMSLPAFEQPGSSLPMERYMPQPAATVPDMPPVVVQAQATAPAPEVPTEQPVAVPPMPESVPVGMDPAKPDVLAALREMQKRNMIAPWAVNEGNLKDQLG